MLRLSPPVRFVAIVLFLWAGLRTLYWPPTGHPFDTIEARAIFALTPLAFLRPGHPNRQQVAGVSQRRHHAPAGLLQVDNVIQPAAAIPAIRADIRIGAHPAIIASSQNRRAEPQSRTLQRSRQARTWFATLTPASFHPLLMRISARRTRAEAGTFSPMALATRPALRWSNWLLYRSGDGPASLAGNGELGGSQAGMALRYRVLRAGPVEIALAGRTSRPIERDRGGEAAIGIAVRPVRNIPVEAVVERRVALDGGGRNAWSLGIAGGVDRQPLPLGFELDGYAQAGIVGTGSRDLYGDASLSVSRPIALSDRTTVSIGGGVWAGAQPGAARVDIGPQATLRFPAASGSARLTLGWRQQVAGNASPGSGPVLTLGTDF